MLANSLNAVLLDADQKLGEVPELSSLLQGLRLRNFELAEFEREKNVAGVQAVSSDLEYVIREMISLAQKVLAGALYRKGLCLARNCLDIAVLLETVREDMEEFCREHRAPPASRRSLVRRVG